MARRFVVARYSHWTRVDYVRPAYVLCQVGPCLLRLPLRPGRVFTLRACDVRRLRLAGARAGPLAGRWLGEAVVWSLVCVSGYWRLLPGA